MIKVKLTVVNAVDTGTLDTMVDGMRQYHGYERVLCTGTDGYLGHYAVLVDEAASIQLDAPEDDTVLCMILDHYTNRDDVTQLVSYDGAYAITLV